MYRMLAKRPKRKEKLERKINLLIDFYFQLQTKGIQIVEKFIILIPIFNSINRIKIKKDDFILLKIICLLYLLQSNLINCIFLVNLENRTALSF